MTIIFSWCCPYVTDNGWLEKVMILIPLISSQCTFAGQHLCTVQVQKWVRRRTALTGLRTGLGHANKYQAPSTINQESIPRGGTAADNGREERLRLIIPLLNSRSSRLARCLIFCSIPRRRMTTHRNCQFLVCALCFQERTCSMAPCTFV